MPIVQETILYNNSSFSGWNDVLLKLPLSKKSNLTIDKVNGELSNGYYHVPHNPT